MPAAEVAESSLPHLNHGWSHTTCCEIHHGEDCCGCCDKGFEWFCHNFVCLPCGFGHMAEYVGRDESYDCKTCGLCYCLGVSGGCYGCGLAFVPCAFAVRRRMVERYQIQVHPQVPDRVLTHVTNHQLTVAITRTGGALALVRLFCVLPGCLRDPNDNGARRARARRDEVGWLRARGGNGASPARPPRGLGRGGQ